MRREISRASVIPSGIAGKTIDSFPSAAESIIGFRFRKVSQKGTTETHFAGTGTALPQGYNLSGRGSTVPPKSGPDAHQKKPSEPKTSQIKLVSPRRASSRKRKERLRGESAPSRIPELCERRPTPISKKNMFGDTKSAER